MRMEKINAGTASTHSFSRETDWFDTPPHPGLHCEAEGCGRVFFDPVVIIPCAHCVCRQHVTGVVPADPEGRRKLISEEPPEEVCPVATCSERFNAVTGVVSCGILVNMAHSLLQRCPYGLRRNERGGTWEPDGTGCPESLARGSIVEHMRQCLFRFVVCPWESSSSSACGPLRFKDLSHHLPRCPNLRRSCGGNSCLLVSNECITFTAPLDQGSESVSGDKSLNVPKVRLEPAPQPRPGSERAECSNTPESKQGTCRSRASGSGTTDTCTSENLRSRDSVGLAGMGTRSTGVQAGPGQHDANENRVGACTIDRSIDQSDMFAALPDDLLANVLSRLELSDAVGCWLVSRRVAALAEQVWGESVTVHRRCVPCNRPILISGRSSSAALDADFFQLQ